MAEENIFAYKLFCHKLFQILIYLKYVKIATPLKKVTPPPPPSFPATCSKLRSSQAPYFENLVGGSTHPTPFQILHSIWIHFPLIALMSHIH